MPQLVFPSTEYRQSYLAAAAEFAAEGRRLVHDVEVTSATFDAVVERFSHWRTAHHIPDGHVPSTVFWLVEGEEFLGQVSLRHALTPWLERVGGHIGYMIRPSARRQGYGTTALRLVLPEAHHLGIDPALVTCDATNTASRRIIEANGGVLENEVEQGEGKPPKLRYWIPTAPR